MGHQTTEIAAVRAGQQSGEPAYLPSASAYAKAQPRQVIAGEI